MVLGCYGDMVIWRDSIFLGHIYNTSCFIYFSNNLKNTLIYDLTYSHVLNTHLESITEEVILLC